MGFELPTVSDEILRSVNFEVRSAMVVLQLGHVFVFLLSYEDGYEEVKSKN